MKIYQSHPVRVLLPFLALGLAAVAAFKTLSDLSVDNLDIGGLHALAIGLIVSGVGLALLGHRSRKVYAVPVLLYMTSAANIAIGAIGAYSTGPSLWYSQLQAGTDCFLYVISAGLVVGLALSKDPEYAPRPLADRILHSVNSSQ